MKTTTEIIQEHKKFLSSISRIHNETPMNEYLEQANKKWYSEEELRDIISACTITNDTFGCKGFIDAELLKIALFGNDEK